MKKHLVISLLAYLGFGVSMTVQNLGIKAGLGFWPTVIIFVGGLLFFVYAAFTHLQKVKDFISDHEKKEPMFDFEKEAEAK